MQNRYNRGKEKGVKHNQNSLRCYKIFECWLLHIFIQINLNPSNSTKIKELIIKVHLGFILFLLEFYPPCDWTCVTQRQFEQHNGQTHLVTYNCLDLDFSCFLQLAFWLWWQICELNSSSFWTLHIDHSLIDQHESYHMNQVLELCFNGQLSVLQSCWSLLHSYFYILIGNSSLFSWYKKLQDRLLVQAVSFFIYPIHEVYH